MPAAFSLLRTSAVTPCPPRISASRTAPPTDPVAPVRKTRIGSATAYLNSQTGPGSFIISFVPRDTLVDFFRDIALARGTFLVYDDGFRTHAYSYADVTAASR